MGYQFTIKNGLRVKQDKEYPWPCDSKPARTIPLFTCDVLTKDKDGTYMKHTGLGCFGIHIPDEDIEPIGEPVSLAII